MIADTAAGTSSLGWPLTVVLAALLVGCAARAVRTDVRRARRERARHGGKGPP